MQPGDAGAYSFSAVTESGERFMANGTITFAPLGSTGHIAVAEFALPKYAAFYRHRHNLDVLQGRLATEADYEINLTDGPVARIRNGTVTVQNLQLAARGATEPVVTLPLLKIEGLAADTTIQQAKVAALLVRDAVIAVERRSNGSLNLSGLFPHPMVPANNPGLANKGWSAALASLKVENATVRFTDLSTPRPVHLVIDQLALALTGAGTQLDKPVALDATLRWNPRGRIAIGGQVVPQPAAADLNVDISDLELRPLDPYLAPFLNVLITGGTARAKGHLTIALPEKGAPDLRWEGDAGVADLATVDGVISEPLVSFADLTLSNLKFTLKPLTVALDEVAFEKPFVHVVIFPDRQVNLTAVVKRNAAPPSAATPTAQGPESTAAPRPHVTTARVSLAGARFAVTDRSVSPAFSTEVTDFAGTVSGLSSEPLARADVDLSGKLRGAPLHITGQINPLSADAFTDLKVTSTGIELPPFTPYAGRLAGYTITSGTLNLDLSYKLSARMIDGENRVELDQFFLGDRVASPEATRLPVKLALAILRDPAGRIEEDLAARGSLDDPDFKY
jgi:hypothetical protein